jgi:hypothetical protein
MQRVDDVSRKGDSIFIVFIVCRLLKQSRVGFATVIYVLWGLGVAEVNSTPHNSNNHSTFLLSIQISSSLISP